VTTRAGTSGVLVAATLALLAALPCRAQVVAPPLERGGAELGFAYKRFHRDVTSGQVSDIDWEVATVYGRYGGWDWLTLTLEGGLWELGALEDTRDLSRWAVGGGLSARVYERAHWKIVATATYNEVYDFDESLLRSDERTRSWTAALLVDGAFGNGPHRVDLWAGPMFVDDLAEVYAFSATDPLVLETDPAVGIAAGAYGVLYDYMSGFAYVVYADHAQFRFGLSIRTGAGEP
jgi:hypothetical protein